MAVTQPLTKFQDTHGSMKKVIGTFGWGGSALELETGLTRVTSFQVQSLFAVADISGVFWINSKTASAVQDDPGFVHIASGLTSGAYSYEARGD